MQEPATQLLGLSQFFMQFIPYVLVQCVAIVLLKGRSSPEVRNHLVLFNAGLIIGTELCMIWLVCNLNMGAARQSGNAFPPINHHAALLSPGVLTAVIGVSVAVMGHGLIHMGIAMRALPKLLRNKIACALIVLALPFALYSPVPQVQYWKQFYNARNYERAIALAQSRDRETDRFTRQWIREHPGDWHGLLLRASFLADSGKTEEARRIYMTVATLPEDSVPDAVRARCRQLSE